MFSQNLLANFHDKKATIIATVKQQKPRIVREENHPLDFSFQEVKELKDLLTLEPTSGYTTLNNGENHGKGKKQNNEDEDCEVVQKIIKTNTKIASTEQLSKEDLEQEDVKTLITCNTVKLGYNQLSSLENINIILSQVIYTTDVTKILFNLRWLDMSHNQITCIHDDLLLLPQLHTLYLHCNNIDSFRDVKKLLSLKNLRKVTLYRNPIELNPNYRMKIIKMLPYLVALDSITITERDRSNANIWYKKSKKKSRKLL